MEENKTNGSNQSNQTTGGMPGHPAGCFCRGCIGWGRGGMYGYHRGFGLVRLLVGLLILAAIFAIGVKIGEFHSRVGGRGYFMDDYRGGMMMRRGNFPYGTNMMYWTASTTPTSTTTPTK